MVLKDVGCEYGENSQRKKVSWTESICRKKKDQQMYEKEHKEFRKVVWRGIYRK